MTTTTTIQTGKFDLVPLKSLHESPHNTRRHRDAQALEELTASIRAHGVLTPLLVRPSADGYEIAPGHRRFKAAQAAGLAEVPAIVRSMTDQQFLEVLTIENLQREDIHALDEAQGYQALLRIKGYDVARIAASARLGTMRKKADEYVPLGKTPDDILRHLAFLELSGDASTYWAPQQFPKQAKAIGLDVKKILDATAPKQPANPDAPGKCPSCYVPTADLSAHVCKPGALKAAKKQDAKRKQKGAS